MGKNSVANKVGGFGSTWNPARTSRKVFIQFEITIQFVVCGCLTDSWPVSQGKQNIDWMHSGNIEPGRFKSL